MSLIEDILKQAKDAGASDVHITVGLPPKMRLNGKLIAMESFGKMLPPDTQAIADEIMSEAQKAKLENNGQCDMSFSIRNVGRYRLNVFKQRGSVAMAFRVVASTIPGAGELGIPDTVIDLYKKKRGLVLVTGPTGSGKSTTLASIIDQINNNREAHVITLEDPIEFTYQHRQSIVNQREIGTDSNSYASALRAALREDPDVILVGEMRDLETIQTAITAAETGHLVFSTLHTNSAADTINRVIDVFPPHQQQQIRVQLASVIECVISQQLLPIQTGSGRVAAFEVMMGTSAVRNLIREGKAFQIPSMIQTSKKQGMQSMDDALYNLYIGGLISAENCLNYAQDTIAMSRKVTF